MSCMSKKTILFNNLKNLNLNFGPQHPAAHGVLRMSLVLNNERVFSCDPHIGLLHRGTEFLITTKQPLLSIPYFDRLDYVSMLTQEHSYCLALESSTGKKPTIFLEKTRVVLDELTRVLNHLLAIACHSLDVGSMSPIFWSFEERENLMEVYENLSGARMHAAFYKPSTLGKTLSFFILKKIINNLKSLPVTLSEVNSILFFNKIWKSRLKSVGVLDYSTDWRFSLSGILSRSCGLKKDLRVLKPTKYSFYKYLKVSSFFSKNGDSYDRFVLRILEIYESVNIINRIVFFFFKKNTQFSSFFSIEKTIFNFKKWTEFFFLKKKESFSYIESPKGIFGVYIFLKKNNKIVKCKIKSPSYNHLFLLKYLLPGHQLADIITLIGTIDIVFGEIDR